MKGIRNKGFTTIEVLLFLAISALMITVLLVAISGGVNRERYRDAVNSFHDFLQGQYNLVDNVQNNRIDQRAGCPGPQRATSECSIIGRFITTGDSNEKIISYPVIARRDVRTIDYATRTEEQVINDLELEVILTGEGVQEYPMPWQTAVVAPGANDFGATQTARPFRMVILRSPAVSVMRTYVSYTLAANTVQAVISENLNTKAYLCVDPRGLTTEKMGVSIDPKGINSSAIQIAPAGECRS